MSTRKKVLIGVVIFLVVLLGGVGLFINYLLDLINYQAANSDYFATVSTAEELPEETAENSYLEQLDEEDKKDELEATASELEQWNEHIEDVTSDSSSYAIPISKDVKNARKNVPLGMMIGLGIICVIQSIMVLGFHHYVPWAELTASPAPHLTYGEALLGKFGKYWMALVSALALISTQNSSVQGLASIGQGMAQMNMLPHFLAKTNKKKVPWIGCIIVSICILIFAWISNDSSDTISFLILVGSVFWMLSYICAHIDVLVFRRRLPKAPRSFKVKGGPVLPLIGIIGTAYMVINISDNPHERNMIFLLTGIVLAVLLLYAVLWTKFKLRMPLFKSVPIHKVLAMEHPMYYRVRKERGIWK